MQPERIDGGGRDPEGPLDCLVLVKDKVLRAMLATCVRSLGLHPLVTGDAQAGARAVARAGRRIPLVLIGPSVEGADSARLAEAFGRHPRAGLVLGFGFKQPLTGIPGVEVHSFPLDFPALVRRLRALLEEDRESTRPAAA